MKEPMVSIVISCYNASQFIGETIASVISQTLSSWEVIVIDDGSIDDTRMVVLSMNDDRIKYIHQSNSGVSYSRNKGMSLAKGRYIVFFDHDDLMSPDFLLSRVEHLENNSSIVFVSSEVKKFNKQGDLPGQFRGTIDTVPEVLFYEPDVVTCPSNFMYRLDFLRANKLVFDERISNASDRLFLIQCGKLGKAECLREKGVLFYRVSENSMGARLTLKHVRDNDLFYTILKNGRIIPIELRNKSLFLGNFILFASYWKLNQYIQSIKYAGLAISLNPLMFVKKVLKKRI